jgi:magnesium transporter
MRLGACHLLRPGQDEAVMLEDIPGLLAEPGNLLFLELDDPDKPTLDRLQKQLGLHELAVEDALAANQRPKVEDYPGGLFVVLRTARWWNNAVSFGETHIFCGERYLLVIRRDTGPGYGRVRERLTSMSRTLTASLALYTLLDHIVDELRPLEDRLEERYAELESVLFDGGFSGDNLARLYAAKREIASLHSSVQPIPEICRDLIRLHSDFVSKELRAYYRDVEDHAIRLAHALDRLRDMISDAMQLALAAASMRQNESVQKLAGWGAILAIPTLVFSLYGMNFKLMPELDWPLGYPAALLATFTACLWLYRRLKQRGWI